jgi:CHAT domain-containing protein
MKTAAALLLLLLIVTASAAAQESPADLLAAAKGHYDARRYKDARATYEKARAAAEAAGEPLIAARAKLGLASFKSMDGQYDEGIALVREAQAAFEAAGDQRGIAGAFLHLGNLHIGAGKFAEAAEYFRKCAAVDGGRKASCLERLGQCQESLGQYRESMATLREAIAAAVATGNRALHASALAGLGDIYTNQGNAELGVHYQKKSIEMFRELGNTAMASAILNNLGIAYNLMGRSDLALEVYRENLASMERLGYTRGINMSKMNIAATLLVKLKRHEEAAPMLVELLAAYERFDDPSARDNVLRLLAEVEVKRGNLSGALEHALQAAAKGTDDVKDVWINHALVGQLYRKLGRFEEARTWLAGAIDTIESMHGHSTGGQVHFFDEPGEAYAEMAILMIDAGRTEEAFEYAERYRSRVLIDVLRGGPVQPSPALSADERQRERELAERLSALQREALHGASPELSERIAVARRERDAFQQELASAHPRLRVERGTLPPVTARDAASRLPREAALVEYLVTEEKTYAFVISGSTIAVRTIDVRKDALAREAESFRALLADRRPDFRKAARSLHQTLIAPIADLLAKRQSWIVVPDGPLWNLPFQALVDARGTYLAEKAAIVYAPSLAAWIEMSRNANAAAAGARGELLAFGNPTTTAAVGVEGTRATLAPLPEAETEVKGAARLYGAASAVYIRDEATEERFKAEAPRYRVLHVAGHGVLNDASPMHSYLLLASGGAKTEDGYLEAGELMQMDLGAELVVLSACDTARGKYAAGEGIIGFSWALFAARCRTQVVSQWKVDSAATSVLMRNFHRNVRGDRTKAASALQKTIVAMLKTKRYRHPFHWAGFVVLGDAL